MGSMSPGQTSLLNSCQEVLASSTAQSSGGSEEGRAGQETAGTEWTHNPELRKKKKAAGGVYGAASQGGVASPRIICLGWGSPPPPRDGQVTVRVTAL